MGPLKSLTNEEIDHILKNAESACKVGRLFQSSIGNALVQILRAFEDRTRLVYAKKLFDGNISNDDFITSHFNAREGMDALTHLIPLVYSNCSQTKNFTLRPYRDEKYVSGHQALEAAITYDHALDGLTLAKIGVYAAKKFGKTVFLRPSRVSMDTEGATQKLSFSSQEKLTQNIRPLNHLVSAVIDARENLSIKSLCHITSGTMTFHLPQFIWDEIKNFAADIEKILWTLDESISFGNYSVLEAKRVWGLIAGISAFHSAVCIYSGTDGIGLDYLPIALKTTYLESLCAQYAGVSINAAKNVIRDLTFGHGKINSEVMFQPLLPIPSTDIILIAPHLITYSFAERNFMKLWSRLYSGIYGSEVSKIGEKKETDIYNLIKEKRPDLEVKKSIKISAGGRKLTDIDLAVYDSATNEVLIGQLKWFIPPDSTLEVRDSDDKLNNAMTQLDKTVQYIANHPEALSSFFGKSGIKSPKLLPVVLTSSNVGSFWLKRDYCVIKTEMLISSIQSGSLSSIVAQSLAKQTFTRGYDFYSAYQKVTVGDTEILIPATNFYVDNSLFRGVIMWLIQGIRIFGYFPFWRQIPDKHLF